MDAPGVGNSRPAWVCHARPAWGDGKACGHPNRDGGKVAPMWDGAKVVALVYCGGCGCTKKASDDRQATEAAPSKPKRGK